MREVIDENDLTSILRDCEKVFVLFYGSWCPFCRDFLPFFEECLRKKHEKFFGVGLDDEMNPLWERYNVEVVPTVILFGGERVLKRLDGVSGVGLGERQLEEFLEGISA